MPMSENEFYELVGNGFRGSRYSNFSGGGVDPQGNVSSAVTENAASAVGTSRDATQDAPPTPITPSQGLTEFETPSTSDMVIGAALPYAGGQIGRAAGTAIAAGSSFGEGISQGISSLANKVSGGLIGSAPAAQTSAAISQSLGKASGPATQNAVNTAGSNLGAAAGSGIGAAAATLLTGGSVKDAAKSGVATAAGTAIGNAIVPGVGGFIGGTIGGIVGGRVICTQLVRMGLLDKADQILDMEFTFHALSHIHVRGYLFWARGWVEKMKRSKALTMFSLKIVQWRLNDIKYILGIRAKPDYRGRAVRFVMENFCFAVGLFLKDTPETTIYRKDRHEPSVSA